MSDPVSALDRLRKQLEDDGFGVTIEGATLYTAKNRGVFYRNLSPVDRITRGHSCAGTMEPVCVYDFDPTGSLPWSMPD